MSLGKAIGAFAGLVAAGVTATVLSKNKKERDEWLKERGEELEELMDEIGQGIEKMSEKVKKSFQ